jgi:hypothetical protein
LKAGLESTFGARANSSCSLSASCAAYWIIWADKVLRLDVVLGTKAGVGIDTASSVAEAEIVLPWQESKVVEGSSRDGSTRAFDAVSDKLWTVTASRASFDCNSMILWRRRLFSSRNTRLLSSSGFPLWLAWSRRSLKRSACLRR